MENYHVTLLLASKGHNPQEAVGNFIESIMRSGLRCWIYTITSEESGETYYSTGDGKLMSHEEVRMFVSDRMAGIPLPDQEEVSESVFEGFVEEEAKNTETTEPVKRAPRKRTKKPVVETVSADVLNQAMGQVASD